MSPESAGHRYESLEEWMADLPGREAARAGREPVNDAAATASSQVRSEPHGYGDFACTGHLLPAPPTPEVPTDEPWCPDHGYGCEPQDCPCGHSRRCDCREIQAYEH